MLLPTTSLIVPEHPLRRGDLTVTPAHRSTNRSLNRRTDLLTRLTDDTPFTLESGVTLPGLHIAVETYGRLNEARDNVILVCHALTGSAHAAGYDANGRPGWWEGVIGPGRAIDTDRFAVVCTNVIGSCYGSTGPTSIDPRTGRAYRTGFPTVTIRDMVRAQRLAVAHLGVERLHAVVGGSMGGLQALEWGILYPESVDRLVVIAAGARQSPWRSGLAALSRSLLDGAETDAERRSALAHARMAAMLAYRSAEEFTSRFGGEKNSVDLSSIERASKTRRAATPVESYLRHQGKRLVERFDVDAYGVLLDATDGHDIGRDRAPVDDVLASLDIPTCVVAVDSDILYPVDEVRALAAALPRGEYREIASIYGHDAFLIEGEALRKAIAPFLNGSHVGTFRGTSSGRDEGNGERNKGTEIVIGADRSTSPDEIRIGLFGCGVVGSGVVRLLDDCRERIARESGRRVAIRTICVLDPTKERPVDLGDARLTTDVDLIIDDPAIDLIIETIGGETVAHEIITRGLISGRDVITANKAVVAEHLPELRRLQNRYGGSLLYGAAVCGSVPILKVIDETLATDTIVAIRGIVNGSTNYILGALDAGGSWEEALASARAKGFLEADPTLDLSGADAAQKLSILAAHAFGVHIPPSSIATEGITGITVEDIARARQEGQRIKLIAEGRITEKGVELSVAPRRLSLDHPLAGVDAEVTAVEIEGRAVGLQRFIGKGAGSLPTANAVVSDVRDLAIARGAMRIHNSK